MWRRRAPPAPWPPPPSASSAPPRPWPPVPPGRRGSWLTWSWTQGISRLPGRYSMRDYEREDNFWNWTVQCDWSLVLGLHRTRERGEVPGVLANNHQRLHLLQLQHHLHPGLSQLHALGLLLVYLWLIPSVLYSALWEGNKEEKGVFNFVSLPP